MVTNVQGTETVLEYCNKFDKRVLIASSSEVYGDHREERAAVGERPPRLRPRHRAPLAVRRLEGDGRVPRARLPPGARPRLRHRRFFNTVGPRQSGQYGMVIPRFVERALAGAPLEVHGDGMQTRSFCHVSDTVRAVIGADGGARRSPARSSTSARRSACASSISRERVLELTGSQSEARRSSRTRGLRARHRGRAAPRAVDREDQRRDRLAAVARPRPHPRGRDRAHAARAGASSWPEPSLRVDRHRGRRLHRLARRGTFLARGDDVLVVDDLSTGASENVPDGASFEEVDIADARRARGRVRPPAPISCAISPPRRA